jgi:hypothetical protein
MSEKNYIVKREFTLYGEQDFEWIGDDVELLGRIQDNEVRPGDEIYELRLVGKIIEKKELFLLKEE